MFIVEKGEAKRGSKKCRSRRREPECAFRGVRKRSWGRYVSEIRLPGQTTRIWLGSFGSAEMAARAYDSAAYFLKGTSAILNFPDLVESLPRPLSSSRRDIQSAAAKAAHNLPSPKTDQIHHDSATTSFHDVKEAPLMSPLSLDIDMDMDMDMDMDSTFPDFSWNQLFDFNHHHHDILVMESTSSFSFLP